jgi:outer membrane protein OmpA-like peptidoglycan-associated protein
MKTYISVISMCLYFILFTGNSTAQINLRDKIKNQTNNRANNKTDQGIDKSLDKVEEGIGNLFKKDKTEKDNAQDQTTDPSQEQQAVTQDQVNQAAATPTLQTYSKFDFIPGEKVIFFDDFSQDAVGDFPALWNTNGSAEVVTTNLFPGNWMKFVMDECVWTDELLKLPENYTMEFDVIPIGGLEGDGMSGYLFRLMQAKNAKAWDGGSAPGEGGFLFNVEYFGRPNYSTWLNKEDCQAAKLGGHIDQEQLKQKMNEKYHISDWVQKSRVRLYQNENKIIDLPKAFPTGCLKPDRIRFEYGAAMISNFRIAVGAPDMRNKLMTEGKLVTYGIYFDVNKDVVKPESYGTLKEIAKILNEVPDVKVKILGHTDADGQDAANLDLSKRRAASVKTELAKNFGVNVDRLDTDGLGETQPVAPNDTPVNKALNRRVEFVKL